MAVELKTLDTDFAAAMMARGARLDGWDKSPDGRKLYWKLTEIETAWIPARGIMSFSFRKNTVVLYL